MSGREIEFTGHESEYRKQYSVYYYWWMKEALGVDDDVLGRAINSNNVNWAAEHVFRVNYREYFLHIENDVLLSPNFGNKTLLQMADDAILIREKAGANLDRVESERVGVIGLEKLLTRMQVGQTAVLVSPPDPNDPDMAGHNMIYIYEKQSNKYIRATAIRDEASSLDDLKVLSNHLSGVSNWQNSTHLEFVARPFVTSLNFSEAVSEVGVTRKDILPNWVEEMSGGIVLAMLDELSRGNVGGVRQIFDAFQMAVKTRHEKQVWIEPMRMVTDDELWMRAQKVFLEVGGMEMIRAGGSCGRGDIGLRDNNVMSELMGVDEREENYSFDHAGECIVCKKDPRLLGPCNICEECDHKIRQQAG